MDQELGTGPRQSPDKIKAMTLSHGRRLEQVITASPQQLRLLTEEALLTLGLESQEGGEEEQRELDEEETWDEEFAEPADERDDADPGPSDRNFSATGPAEVLALAADEAGQIEVADALAAYQRGGGLPDDASPLLRAAVAAADARDPLQGEFWPAIEVTVRGGRVDARVMPTPLDGLYRTAGGRGRWFTSRLFRERELRLFTLQAIADEVLVGVQGDFFRAPNLSAAVRSLLPLTPALLAGLQIPEVRLTAPLLSRLGELIVSTPLGPLELALFWPSLAAVGGVWVRAALVAGVGAGLAKKREVDMVTLDWIRTRLDVEGRRVAGGSVLRLAALELLDRLDRKAVANRRAEIARETGP